MLCSCAGPLARSPSPVPYTVPASLAGPHGGLPTPTGARTGDARHHPSPPRHLSRWHAYVRVCSQSFLLLLLPPSKYLHACYM